MFDIMALNEHEHENEPDEHCTGDLDAPCHPEACRKFEVFIPITVTPFGKANKEHITVDCVGNLRTVNGNPCQGIGPTAHKFTVAQTIKVLIPLKFGANVCVDESCDEDLGNCQGVEPTDITLCHSNIKINRNRTHQFTATVLPEDAEDKSVTWKSENETYVTITATGLATGIRRGTTRIMGTTVNNKSAYCTVEVEDDQ